MTDRSRADNDDVPTIQTDTTAHLSPDDPSLLPIYNNFGLIYRAQGGPSAALINFNHALQLQLNTETPNQEWIASYYNNIGTAYKQQYRYSEALEMYEKALQIHLQILPSNHPSIAVSYNYIATVYESLEDYDRAPAYYTKTLEMQQHLLSSNHPHLAQTYFNFSWTYYGQGKLNEASGFCSVDGSQDPHGYGLLDTVIIQTKSNNA
ncbi:unnamed protein product [Didymodactylos carnosus]|uniref:Tetratricopeptide repeat protein n=1 Tax=Didymodactylos carnosus TaxID=1234261 RepID=A0A8S2DYN6_9BILA|nr:unnamed protein product [Didymodactylos carnosus]CAF3799199.1 unnamed protein product [Didymodactylos carnosus]